MYDSFEQDAPLSQGDIINNVVFSYIPSIANPAFIVGDDYVERDLTQPFDPTEDLLIVGQAIKAQVLVITPDCNIDYDRFICVARIFPLHDTNYNQMSNLLRKAKYLKNNYQHTGVNPTTYYLQESPQHNFPKSLASFLEIHTIRRTDENLAYFLHNRILRLTKEAIGDLQYRIGYFFGRFTVNTENYMLTDEERRLIEEDTQS